MRLFWLKFLISGAFCLLIVFLTGFSLAFVYSAHEKSSLFKKSVKLDNFLLLKHLNRQLDFFIQSASQVEKQDFLLLESPFQAFAGMNQSKVETLYLPESLPFSEKEESSQKELSPLELKKRKELIKRIEQIPASQAVSKMTYSVIVEGKSLQETLWAVKFSPVFQFHVLQEKNQKFVFLVKSLNKEKIWVAHLKGSKDFFNLSALIKKEKGIQKEFFALNSEGQILFHSQKKEIFKKLPEKSFIWPSIEKLSQEKSSKGKYLSSLKNKKKIHYIQKWPRGDLFLVSQSFSSSFSLPFLSADFSYYIFWTLLVFFLIFLFLFLFRLMFYLTSSYEFLKMAFVSFSRTGFFPSAPHSPNPFLYFYKNRQFFVNQKVFEKREDLASKDHPLNFQEIVKQELKELKSKYPRLNVKENFDFDVKVFSFEKFLRTVVREILLNAMESMGGVREPQLDLSLKKKEKELIFSVRDYGVGVLKKNNKKVFQMYYSTKSQMGVGLNVAQSIVQANEGRIEFSSPERGTEVHVILPMKCFLKNHE